jgi:SAM-dependent methyltransferase
MTSPLTDKHLDIGCGKFPRNPYGRGTLCGVDLRALPEVDGFECRSANVVVDPIPYDDNSFGSVSAYDFIEHVPRVLSGPDGRSTVFPFIRLMNEIWRVLAPGGRFYAVTPCYPSPAAFQDPTHVNIITEQTHIYFTGDSPLARMYGFTGSFELVRAEWGVYKDSLAPQVLSTHQRVRRWNYARKGKLTHFVWEFAAVKPTQK